MIDPKPSVSAQVQALLQLPLSQATARDLQELRAIFSLMRSSQGSILDEAGALTPVAAPPSAPAPAKKKDKIKPKPRGASRRGDQAAAAPVIPAAPAKAQPPSRRDDDEPGNAEETSNIDGHSVAALPSA